MTDNKLDPIHAVASMALALVEIQKELSQLRRFVDVMANNIHQIDQGSASAFKKIQEQFNSVDESFKDLNRILKVTELQGGLHSVLMSDIAHDLTDNCGGNNAADKEREENIKVDEKDIPF